jgi:hypothetical protein
MNQLFIKEGLIVQVTKQKLKDNDVIYLLIESDYAGSQRKSTLNVNENWLSAKLLNFWKSVKTKKIQSAHLYFTKYDYYHSTHDLFETPTISIKRGLKKPRTAYDTHDEIPKDWGVVLQAKIEVLKSSATIMDIIITAVGHHLSEADRKTLKKDIQAFLNGKKMAALFRNEY